MIPARLRWLFHCISRCFLPKKDSLTRVDKLRQEVLRGKRSEGKGKGILGACEARMPRNRRRKEDEGRERLQGRYCIFVIPILLLTVIW